MLKFKILLLFLTLLWLHPAQGSLLQVGSNDFMALPDTTVSTAHPDTLIVGSFEQYLLPVRISGADLVSAISLRLNIPKAFVAADSLLVKSGVTGYLTSITDSVVILAWSSVNPLVLIDGDTLVSLLISTLDLEGLVIRLIPLPGPLSGYYRIRSKTRQRSSFTLTVKAGSG